MDTMISIFISYARKDSEFAKCLHHDLSHLNIGVWQDEIEIYPGDELQNVLAKAIQNTDILCLILSPDSVKSKWCEWELKLARQLGKRVVPILYKDCTIPQLLTDVVFVNFMESCHSGIKSFIRALKKYPDENSLRRQISTFFIQKAISLEENGELKVAEDAYQAAIAADDTYSDAYYDYSVFFFMQGLLERRRELLLLTISHDPCHIKALLEYGSDLAASKDFNEAIKYLTRAAQLIEEKGLLATMGYIAYYQLGHVKLLINESLDAIDPLRKALRLATQQRDQTAVLLLLYFATDNVAKPGFCMAYLEEYIIIAERIGKPDVKHYVALIEFFCKNGMIEKAKEFYAKLFSNHSEDRVLAKEMQDYIGVANKFVEELKKTGVKEIMTSYRSNYETGRVNLYNDPALILGRVNMSFDNDKIIIPVPKKY